MQIVLAHGWAYRPHIWVELIDDLARRNPDIRFVDVDFGFFGESEIPSGHFDLAIGHSFGLLWLLDQKEIVFDKVVSIGGFTRFFKGREFPAGTHPRVLSRMQENLKSDIGGQLTRFWDQADDRKLNPGPDLGNANRERLDWGLGGLKSWDLREQWSSLDIPEHRRMVIAANKDSIVSAELSKACFGLQKIQWINSNNHLLPVTETTICASLIQKLIVN